MDQIPNVPPQASQPKSTAKAVPVAIAIVVVLILAGIGYAFATGKLGGRGLGSATPTLDEVRAAFADIRTAHLQSAIDLRSEPKDADVSPVSLTEPWATSTDATEEEKAGALPNDVRLSLSLAGSWQKSAENADAETHATGTYHGNGLTAEFDLAVKKVKDRVYLQINTLPIPIIDLTPVQGKWISWSKDDAAKLLPGLSQASTTEPEKKTGGEETKEFDVLWQEGIKQGAWKIGKAERVDVNGRPAWHLELAFDPAAFQTMFVSVYQHKDQMLAGVAQPQIFTDKNEQTVSHAGYVEWLRDLTRNARAVLWLDQATKQPLRIAFDVRLAPKTTIEKFKDKQVHAGISVDFSDINQPITVTAPAQSMGVEEAMGLILGGGLSATSSEPLPLE